MAFLPRSHFSRISFLRNSIKDIGPNSIKGSIIPQFSSRSKQALQSLNYNLSIFLKSKIFSKSFLLYNLSYHITFH